ncbi:hypothetical protein GMRT_11069 [Giardia muris]|uniref:Uncharacterized protein n=1 Tax=Giardia muris TaxID=5742 RepID=A0A4Z1SX62_GIAMU|nr:hypothetical protein GMRT_11069 [Giardia muris]|eukprot:TNJ30130.1 hypothetical protein GMRT_11069 [Giardia muris]
MACLIDAHIIAKNDRRLATARLRELEAQNGHMSHTVQLSLAVIGARSTGKTTLAALLAGLPAIRFSPSQGSSHIVTSYVPAGSTVVVKRIVHDIHYEDQTFLPTTSVVFTLSPLNINASIKHVEAICDQILEYQDVLFVCTKVDQATNDEFVRLLQRLSPLAAGLRARKVSCSIRTLNLLDLVITPKVLHEYLDLLYMRVRYTQAKQTLLELEERFLEGQASFALNTATTLVESIEDRKLQVVLEEDELAGLLDIASPSGARRREDLMSLYTRILSARQVILETPPEAGVAEQLIEKHEVEDRPSTSSEVLLTAELMGQKGAEVYLFGVEDHDASPSPRELNVSNSESN